MTVYSEAFCEGVHTGTGAVKIFTVPDADKYVVRDVVLHHADTTSHRLAVYVHSGGVDSYICSDAAVVSKQATHWDGRQVLRPQDELWLITDCATLVTYRVAGYRLTI